MIQETSISANDTAQEVSDPHLSALQMTSVTPLALHHYHENTFIIEDSFYRSRLPKPTHWSVVWSDLMMTMFILFLCMFVYQAAHKDFLVDNTPEVIGGSTMDAIEVDEFQDLIVPIVPLRQTAPLIAGGSVLQVEKVELEEVNIDEVFREGISSTEKVDALPEIEETEQPPDPADATKPEAISEIPAQDVIPSPIDEIVPAAPPAIPQLAEQEVIEPAPVIPAPPKAVAETKEPPPFREIYDMSQQALDSNKLDSFASIDLIPDKTMRIILTGDLLFPIGQATLSDKAKASLNKIAAVIKRTPYMINVIGHTDNSPMSSPQFASNWELSVVRASRVARFLINTTGMNPQQFIVSGYGSHRPRVPNNNVSNRAANRRVEIVISKRLAPAVKATPQNLL